MTNKLSGIEDAAIRSGGVLALAQAMAIRHQRISDWIKWGHVPPKHVMQVARISGIPVERLLRPKRKKANGAKR